MQAIPIAGLKVLPADVIVAVPDLWLNVIDAVPVTLTTEDKVIDP